MSAESLRISQLQAPWAQYNGGLGVTSSSSLSVQSQSWLSEQSLQMASAARRAEASSGLLDALLALQLDATASIAGLQAHPWNARPGLVQEPSVAMPLPELWHQSSLSQPSNLGQLIYDQSVRMPPPTTSNTALNQAAAQARLGRRTQPLRKGPPRFAECLAVIETLGEPNRVLKVSRVAKLGVGAVEMARQYFEQTFGPVEHVLEAFPEGDIPSDMIYVVMASVADADRVMEQGETHYVRTQRALKVQRFRVGSRPEMAA